MTRIQTFGARSQTRIANTVRLVEHLSGGREGVSGESLHTRGERQTRYAKTATSSQFPTYPAAPATKFLIRLGELKFDDTTLTTETAVFTPYNPNDYRIMYSEIGWIPLGSVCRVHLHHGRWYLTRDIEFVEHWAVTNVAISAGGSGQVTVYKNGSSVPAWTLTAYLIWMHGGTSIAINKQVLIRWYPDLQPAGKWVIVARQCP